MSEQHNLFYWQTLIGKSKNQEKKCFNWMATASAAYNGRQEWCWLPWRQDWLDSHRGLDWSYYRNH